MVAFAVPANIIGRLDASHSRVIERASAGRIDPRHLKSLGDLTATFAFDLVPRPIDPVADLRESYNIERLRLLRLVELDPATEVSVSADDGYTYTFTPRTVLRRVLDHALDHLNQIDQWLYWRDHGVAPTPTDGWASSADDLAEDHLAISQADLDAWMWRIDLVRNMLAHRASLLTVEQLDWQPPDGGWTLRHMLHHVSRGFYTAWLANPLPEEPLERYQEGHRRLVERMSRLIETGVPENHAFYGWDESFTIGEAIEKVLTAVEESA